LRSAKCANHFDRLCMLKHTAPSQGKVGAWKGGTKTVKIVVCEHGADAEAGRDKTSGHQQASSSRGWHCVTQRRTSSRERSTVYDRQLNISSSDETKIQRW
jgi:hypothetical protein